MPFTTIQSNWKLSLRLCGHGCGLQQDMLQICCIGGRFRLTGLVTSGSINSMNVPFLISFLEWPHPYTVKTKPFHFWSLPKRMLNHVHVYLCECFQTALVDVGTRLLAGVWRNLKPNHETWPRAAMVLKKFRHSFPHSSRLSRPRSALCWMRPFFGRRIAFQVESWKVVRNRNWSVLHDFSCQKKNVPSKRKGSNSDSGSRNGKMGSSSAVGVRDCPLPFGAWRVGSEGTSSDF